MSFRLEGDGWAREFTETDDVRGVAPNRIVILKPVSETFFKTVIAPMLLVEGVALVVYIVNHFAQHHN